VRGEDLTGDGRFDASVLEVPVRLEPWEPAYPLATYHASRADFGDVPSPRLLAIDLAATGVRAVDDPDACGALLDLAAQWTRASGGVATAVAVEGGATAAISALGVERCRFAVVSPDHALAVMAWTAASGGAHGRRRGMAYGRFAAWWAAAALTGLLEGWPVSPGELGAAIRELRWYRWDGRAAPVGWWLGLAVEDPTDGLAWALRASDRRDET
jgi:hypothetical protein